MAWTINTYVKPHAGELAPDWDIFTAGADVSNVLSGGERWVKCDLTANLNEAEFLTSGSSSLDRISMQVIRFWFDTNPTSISAEMMHYSTLMLRINTDRKLEWYDGAAWHTGSAVLVANTIYELAIVLDGLNGTKKRMLLFLDKVLELDFQAVTLQGSTFYYFGVDLGAANPGCSLYFNGLINGYSTDAADIENLYQWQLVHAVGVSDGTLTEWDPVGGGAHYVEVEDVPPDDAQYVSTSETGDYEEIMMTTRANMGIGVSDTVLASQGWFRIKSTANGGSKWDADKGYKPTDHAWDWVTLADPGASWDWEMITTPSLDEPTEFNGWGLGLRTAGSNHDKLIYCSTMLGFAVYYGSGHALQKPRTRQVMIV